MIGFKIKRPPVDIRIKKRSVLFDTQIKIFESTIRIVFVQPGDWP